MERSLNPLFDTPVPRWDTLSYKWEGDLPDGVELSARERRDVIPMWVADMDFPVADCIQEALQARLDDRIFGYTKVPGWFYGSVRGWFRDRHGVDFPEEWMLYTSGVVPALSAVVKALCRPGDGVVVQTPVYNCFFSSIRNNGCRIVESPLLRVDSGDGSFTYRFDFEGLDKACSDPSVKILLLCNPHNPAGRLWSREELLEVSRIASRHGVAVVSDEIHCELTMPGTMYVPFASVDGYARTRSITLLSPSKSFNTAGLQIAVIATADGQWRHDIDRAININEVCDVNPFGVVAAWAAYSPRGEQWLEGLREVVSRNYRILVDRFASELPGFPVCRLEATYLAWVDCSGVGIDSDNIERELLREEHVWVNAGRMYGEDGYIRINLACPLPVLEEGLGRIVRGLRRLSE